MYGFVTMTTKKGDDGVMKYTSANPPLQCFMTQSTWYKGAGTVAPRGVLVHSTGANNPNIKRYVQPDDNAVDKAKMLALLGTNPNRNDWNHITRQAGVHAFVGKLANGEVTSVQVGPWSKQAWGCGAGSKGSCNNGWIQYEICEDALTDASYFNAIYREAVELTAYLCRLYGLDPHGTVTYSGVKVPVILCHQDSYRLGFGSNHGDVLHWFPKFGKSMDDFRDDVAALIGDTQADINAKEDDDMEVARFKELWHEMRKELQDNDSSSWSKDAREWAISTGMVAGMGTLPNGETNYAWADLLTREQMAVLLYKQEQRMMQLVKQAVEQAVLRTLGR